MSATVNKQITIDCPGCGKKYSFHAEKLPEKTANAACKSCDETMTIPSRNECLAKIVDDGAIAKAPGDANKKMMTCPRCHKEQTESPECVYCGVVLFKHFKKSDQEEAATAKISNKKSNSKTDKPPKSENKSETSEKQTGRHQNINPKLLIGGSAAAVVLIIALVVGVLSFGKMSTEEIVAQTEDAVALIKHNRGNGSGFIIHDNILATNYHVIESVFPEDLELYFPSVSNEPLEAGNVVFFDESRDIALIEINVDRSPLTISSADSLKRGEDVVIIGSPGIAGNLILKNSVARGTLNSEKELMGQKYLQISASINPGNSGGPALNYKGEVVAIITLKAVKQEGITFGIPLHEIVPNLHAIEKFSQEERAKANDEFIACSLFKRLSEYAKVNLTAMSLYIEGMNEAINANLTANYGLNAVAKEIDPEVSEVNNWIAPEKIDKYLRKIHQSNHVEDIVKENLLDLWKCAKLIRDYVDHPRGNLQSYTNKRDRLYSRFEGIKDTLRIRLNVNES